ncbi:Rad17-domain-containing protein [Martensiomyces pterosporus]|nr:Rad17-domain-containing protein [Martensiomyces pterosporus]
MRAYGTQGIVLSKDKAPEGGVITIPSSPETKAAAIGSGGSDSDLDLALDFDFDFDNEFEQLEASLKQTAQGIDAVTGATTSQLSSQSSNSQASTQPRNGYRKPSAETGRRRAISDRPKFKLARPASKSHAEEKNPDDESAGTDGGANVDREHDMWWQRYEPQSTAELAVHQAKIAQVRGWLEAAAAAADGSGDRASAYFRVLVLEGPAGAGKSTCARVLAKDLGLDVVEWINTQSGKLSAAGALDYDSSDVGVVRQFEDFLLRAERYSSLALSSSEGGSSAVGAHRPGSRQSRGQIIIVDDLPNISHRDTRDSFRSALMRFISIPARQSFPLVIVVTDSFSTHQGLEGDGFGVGRRLSENDRSSHSEISTWCAPDIIPSAVYNSSYCQSIKFNPVAPTIVAKGLKRILQIRQGLGGQKNARFTPACTAAVKAISGECTGDLRSAITMLQLSQAASPTSDTSAAQKPATGSKRRRAAPKAVDVMGEDAQKVAGEARHAPLDLFHALGKVLYAKREDPGAQDATSGEARGRLESSPDEVLDRLPMDMGTFGLYVHENYTDFCTDIDEVAQTSMHLSEADSISGSKRGRQGAFAVADLYSAMLTVRGYMHSKGHPSLIGSTNNASSADGDPQSSARSQDQYRRSMNSFRKPQFFDRYKQGVLNSRISRDPLTAELLSAGGLPLAGVAATQRSFAQDSLPYWAQIVSRGRKSALIEQKSPAMYRQLMHLAMAGEAATAAATQQPPPPTATQQPPPPTAAENDIDMDIPELNSGVLSDDDIEEFSD